MKGGKYVEFFQVAKEFIIESYYELLGYGIDHKDIAIQMPNYFREAFARGATEQDGYFAIGPKEMKFMGMDIFPAYENAIVVYSTDYIKTQLHEIPVAKLSFYSKEMQTNAMKSFVQDIRDYYKIKL